MSEKRQRIRPGSRLSHRETGENARVMTISEGWVMVRPTGAKPVMVNARELYLHYEVTKW